MDQHAGDVMSRTPTEHHRIITRNDMRPFVQTSMVTNSLWTTHNNILHSTNNHVSTNRISSLKDKCVGINVTKVKFSTIDTVFSRVHGTRLLQMETIDIEKIA